MTACSSLVYMETLYNQASMNTHIFIFSPYGSHLVFFFVDQYTHPSIRSFCKLKPVLMGEQKTGHDFPSQLGAEAHLNSVMHVT